MRSLFSLHASGDRDLRVCRSDFLNSVLVNKGLGVFIFAIESLVFLKYCSPLNNSEGDNSASFSKCYIETGFTYRLSWEISFFSNSDKRFICGCNVAANSSAKNSISYFKNSATLLQLLTSRPQIIPNSIARISPNQRNNNIR